MTAIATASPPMLAETLISSRLPAVRPSDAARDVLTWMDELGVPQLPVVENQELLGLVSESELRNGTKAAAQLADIGWKPPHGTFVYGSQHAYDVVALLRFSGNAVVPVLDPESKYQGAIGREEVLQFVGEMLAVGEPGGIVVLEVDRASFHLREIASIIESNGARVLSLYISTVPDTHKVHVTIKLSQSELTPLLLGFERYGYTVAYTFFDSKQLDDTRDRYEALIRYLSI